MTNRQKLATPQRVAESILGSVQWQGADGYCRCPGERQHTKPSTERDLHVVVQTIPEAAPGVYCFHNSCAKVLAEVNRRLRRALRALGGPYAPLQFAKFVAPRKPASLAFNPAILARIASKMPEIDEPWFAARSKMPVEIMTPAKFLRELYAPGENVLVFDHIESQGQSLWTRSEFPGPPMELDGFRYGKPCGVWFLANPVSGELAATGRLNQDGSPHQSRRSSRTVTTWRYLVLESDSAEPAHWLAALAQLPLPIAAIYTSGGRSIHALVRIDAVSKTDWDRQAGEIKPVVIPLGADPGAITAVRLTRLPCCERLGTHDRDGKYMAYPQPRLQKLLYLNGAADGTPIYEQEVLQ